MKKIIWFIIVIIVGGGLFGWYYMTRLDDVIEPHQVEITDNTDQSIDAVSEDPCIINVMSPQPGDMVGMSFDVSGEASSCIHWGGVNVYDDTDTVLSAFAITIGEIAEEGVVPFFVRPELRFQPKTKSGYIIVQSADERVSQRVNIKFENGLDVED